MIDSSTVRTHRCAAGLLGDSEPREVGRSRRGGRRRSMPWSAARADCAGAEALLDGLETGCVLIADKAYDADAVLKRAVEVSCRAVIPSEPNRRR